MTKVTFSSQAEDHLKEIAAWIARDNPVRAVSHNDELVDVCIALGGFPRAYPRWPHRSQREIRRLNHGEYAIFYEVSDENVYVLAVVHGARDITSLTDTF